MPATIKRRYAYGETLRLDLWRIQRGLETPIKARDFSGTSPAVPDSVLITWTDEFLRSDSQVIILPEGLAEELYRAAVHLQTRPKHVWDALMNADYPVRASLDWLTIVAFMEDK